MKISEFGTYLAWYKSDFNNVFSLSFENALVWFDHVVTWGCGFNLVNYIPCLGSVLDFNMRDQLLGNIALSLINLKLDFLGGN